MCGIYGGWITIEECLAGLKKLQNRGCDSWGVAGNITTQKFLGKDIPDTLPIYGQPIIAHTRWASNGTVNLNNAQPMDSELKNVTVCHNGTLTGYEEIQWTLTDFYEKDYKNLSDTAVLTDFIAYMLEHGYSERKWKEQIDFNFDGTYAIIFIESMNDNIIYFMTRDIPLYYHEGKFASDPSLFPEYFPLPNNSYGWVSKETLHGTHENITKYILSINNELVIPTYIKNEFFGRQSETNSNEPLMLQEIREQATIQYERYLGYSDNLNHKIMNYIDFCGGHDPYDNITIIGCGSSYNAALLGKKYFELGWPNLKINLQYSSEYQSSKAWDGPKIAITQSGETADTLEVMRKWRENKEKNVILITNKSNSTCTQFADSVYYIETGPEQAVAATKTFTATCMTLLALGKTDLYNDLNFKQFRKSINNSLKLLPDIENVAKQIKDYTNYIVLGSGLNYPCCRELSLKLKEVSQIHAESVSAGEFKHGPLSVLDNKTLGIFILPSNKDYRHSRIINNAQQIKARGGKLLSIGPQTDKVFDYSIVVDKTDLRNALLQPLINNVAGQLLSYSLGINKGLNVDFCKNLAKAITVY